MKSNLFGRIPIKFALGSWFLAAALLIAGTAQAQNITWGKINDPAKRFQVLANFNNEAVLDRETGLIWQACPNGNGMGTWETAIIFCFASPIGGRMGWRLPTIEEVLSLGTPGNTPFLPNSSPFCNPTQNEFWSSTTHPSINSTAWAVDASNSSLFNHNKGSTFGFRCVRGGQANDSGQ